ncbi:alkene reductase [Synechococcus elongatus]|uniref:alkene reductase n=1 Tax=Synechococcus elongatus TaxID=32046 RepID=UPI000F7F36C7|nr:alkene reductase [Synechococcus elongatus]
MSESLKLLTPVQVGRYELRNRIVMAPLTRNRATGPDNIPNDLNVLYYQQRASAGLIITEASQISPQGQGYPLTPGIHSPEQVEGWKPIVQAVHDRGGCIFLQLWHVGRISHPSLQPDGALPVAPSAIQPAGYAATFQGEQPFVTPRALETEEIAGIVEDYRRAAENALAAGFDGVEVHGANGYLIDQFLQDGTNQRSDRYGGSFENRSRFLREVLDAVVSVWGSDRVGLRLSPWGQFNDMHDSDPVGLFSYVAQMLNPYNLAYLHWIEPRWDKAEESPDFNQLATPVFRSLYNGPVIAAGGYSRSTAEAAIASGAADLVAFGRLYISNPDLVERFALDAPLNPYDRNTFYGGDEHGYTDYPSLEAASV